MNTVHLGLCAAIAAFGLMAAVGGAEAAKKKPGKCVIAGGQGTGLGVDLSKQMAADGLKDALNSGGMKGVGKITYKCDTAATVVVTSCTARQRACK